MTPLNQDDPRGSAVMEDGTIVSNLTAEEYEATYASGTTHAIPAEVLRAVNIEAGQIARARKE